MLDVISNAAQTTAETAATIELVKPSPCPEPASTQSQSLTEVETLSWAIVGSLITDGFLSREAVYFDGGAVDIAERVAVAIEDELPNRDMVGMFDETGLSGRYEIGYAIGKVEAHQERSNPEPSALLSDEPSKLDNRTANEVMELVGYLMVADLDRAAVAFIANLPADRRAAWSKAFIQAVA